MVIGIISYDDETTFSLKSGSISIHMCAKRFCTISRIDSLNSEREKEEE